LFPLYSFNLGIVAFSALDFQWQGDYLLLLCSASFFLALAWIAFYEATDQWLSRFGPGPARAVAAGVLLLAGVAMARPAFLRPGIPLHPGDALIGTKWSGEFTTLQDQREVADAILQRADGERMIFLDRVELHYLVNRPNPMPLIYWNYPVWTHFRHSENESNEQTLSRLLEDFDPDVLIYPAQMGKKIPLLEGYDPEIFNSKTERYKVRLFVR
jgi:hypothetical protein